MKKLRLSITPKLLLQSLWAVLSVFATTLLMLLIGRDTLGEAVIALLYLVPVVWSASRWGQVAGTSAALTAGLTFNFFFIPPFLTFQVASLEGWLVLFIFLAVAILVVGRIQASLNQAREATFMYEFSSALAGLRTQEAVAHTVTRYLQRLFLASQVIVVYQPTDNSNKITAKEPSQANREGRPDRILPILNAWGLVGEIQIFSDPYAGLPSENSRLLQNFAMQTARAFERTRQFETEVKIPDENPSFMQN
jgi:K+-sensing histidine kinase KdpD